MSSCSLACDRDTLGSSGEASWYLRDANWDPDFPTSAKKIEWFINKELNQEVAGVIAVDVDFISQIVDTMGSVYLSDLQTTVTAQNFYQSAQQQAEANSFPGSHQKGDFLSSVADAILFKIKQDPQLNWLQLAQTLSTAFQSKHALAYFNQPLAQQLITEFNLHGGVGDQLASSSSVLGTSTNQILDHLYLVEANLGVNKTNQYISRSIKHTINLQDASDSTTQLTINYLNQSGPHTWLGGAYKNYLRLYLPLGTQLDQITIESLGEGTISSYLPNDEESSSTSSSSLSSPSPTPSPSDTADTDLQSSTITIDKTVEHGLQVFGFLVTVPPQSQYQVNIDYTLPSSSLSTQTSYQLLTVKQPGTNDDPYQLTINYPLAYRPTNIQLLPSTSNPPSDLTSDLSLQYNSNLSTDQTININFIKQKIKKL